MDPERLRRRQPVEQPARVATPPLALQARRAVAPKKVADSESVCDPSARRGDARAADITARLAFESRVDWTLVNAGTARIARSSAPVEAANANSEGHARVSGRIQRATRSGPSIGAAVCSPAALSPGGARIRPAVDASAQPHGRGSVAPRITRSTGAPLIRRLLTVKGTQYDRMSAWRELVLPKRLFGDAMNGKLVDDVMAALELYELRSVQFATVSDFVDELTLAVRPQELLTENYWRSKLQSIETRKDSKLLPKTQSESYFATYGATPGDDEPERRADDILTKIGPKLLDDIAEAAQRSVVQLKLYRAMTAAEAMAILDWHGNEKRGVEAGVRKRSLDIKAFHQDRLMKALPMRGHIGDREQASSHLVTGAGVNSKNAKTALLEITLKKGVQHILFDPKYMALARAGKVNAIVAEVQSQEGKGVYPAASLNEGQAPGYLGVKSENRGAFSLAIGDTKVTSLLFQLMIDRIEWLNRPPAPEDEGPFI